MKTTFAPAMLTAMVALTLATATGCAVDAQEPAAENTATETEALSIGSGGTGGTSLWCACKLNCDNDYAGIPNLIRLCKAQCDADNKCRKGVASGGTGVYIQ